MSIRNSLNLNDSLILHQSCINFASIFTLSHDKNYYIKGTAELKKTRKAFFCVYYYLPSLTYVAKPQQYCIKVCDIIYTQLLNKMMRLEVQMWFNYSTYGNALLKRDL